MEQRLAKITKVTLDKADFGRLTSYLQLEYSTPGYKIGGAAQGFGGYGLEGEYAFLWINGVLNAVGVSDWNKVAGKYVYADIEGGLVRRITGVDTGKTFDPSIWGE